MRSLVRQVHHAGRLATAPWRALPDFVLIGAQKAGTTSLYNDLARHPQVLSASRKEVHYFDVEYARGERWYRSHFPTTAALRRGSGPARLTGEASPYYLRHPLAPQRCAALLPGARLLVLLRHPTERAHSHWRHARRLGFETLDFAPALAAERARAAAGTTTDEQARHQSYLARGRYAEQLQAWLAHFPREQLLVHTSEQLFAAPEQVYGRVLEFVGLPPFALADVQARNVGPPASLDPGLAAELDAEFAEPNRRLAALLGWQEPWPGRVTAPRSTSPPGGGR